MIIIFVGSHFSVEEGPNLGIFFKTSDNLGKQIYTAQQKFSTDFNLMSYFERT